MKNISTTNEVKYFEDTLAMDKKVLNNKVSAQKEAVSDIMLLLQNQLSKMSFLSGETDSIDFTTDIKNVLLLGHHGVGKTTLVNTATNLCNIPFVSIDAKDLVNFSNICDSLRDLYLLSGKNLQKAQCSVIFIDNIDRIIESTCSHNDDLISLLRGEKFRVEIQENESIIFDTENILIIAAGCFENTYREVATIDTDYFELKDTLLINCRHAYEAFETLDLNGYREFFEQIIIMNYLDDCELGSIMGKPSSLYNQLLKEFEEQGIKVIVSKEAKKMLVRQAVSLELGVIGLNFVVYDLMQRIKYDLEKYEDISSCKITRSYVIGLGMIDVQFK